MIRVFLAVIRAPYAVDAHGRAFPIIFDATDCYGADPTDVDRNPAWQRIGVIVRNSIFLVAFISIRPQNDVPLSEAITRAGTIRPRPILLTAAALMEGAFVIVLDPIFAGLAVTGAGTATLLTLVVIQVL